MAIKVKVGSGTPQVIPSAKEVNARILSVVGTPPPAAGFEYYNIAKDWLQYADNVYYCVDGLTLCIGRSPVFPSSSSLSGFSGGYKNVISAVVTNRSSAGSSAVDTVAGVYLKFVISDVNNLTIESANKANDTVILQSMNTATRAYLGKKT